jgi:ADP-dependent NAD(P)H-hydrate dehydratase
MHKIESIPKLQPRASESHKGDFGKVCIIAGSLGMSGAAALAGRSTLRAGAGLVRIATPKSILPIVASIEPSFTTIPLPEDNEGRISSKAINIILDIVKDNDVIAIGPGLGTSRELRSVIEALLEQNNLKLVIDADGLNNLAAIKNWHEKLKANLVLTPHPGEMKRLWSGLFREPIHQDRQELAIKMAAETNAVIVLKGSGTIVTHSNKIYINTTGNTGMATAGSGDVLTGVIAALLGQGLSSFDAAVLGVYIHGLAGDIAAEKLGQVGMIATDIIDNLPYAFKKIQ